MYILLIPGQSLSSFSTRALPRKPVAPVTNIFVSWKNRCIGEASASESRDPIANLKGDKNNVTNLGLNSIRKV